MPVHLLRLGVVQPVVRANKTLEVLNVLRNRGRQKAAEPGAYQLLWRRLAVPPRHSMVARGKVGVAVEELDLLVFRATERILRGISTLRRFCRAF